MFMSKLGLPMKVGTAALLAGITSIATATSAGASPPFHPTPLKVVRAVSSDYLGPLQFAVSSRYTYVADTFTATLSRLSAGTSTVIASNPPTGIADGSDIAGVAVDQDRQEIAYTSSQSTGGEEGIHIAANLTILKPGGKKVVADLNAFEHAYNPDQAITYGVVGSASKCATDALNAAGIPLSYKGQVDSHPYAVTSLGGGSWAVAEAGGNDIVKVDQFGKVSLIKVMPGQDLKITAEFAASQGLPSCVAGITYRTEAVPTDIEIGPGGAYYVTTLPGGPEGPGIGPRGSVYTISPSSSHYTVQIATGLADATNVAIDKAGNVFAVELGTSQISEIHGGKLYPVLQLPGVAAIEYANGRLWASTAPALFSDPNSPPPPGQILLLGT